MEHIATIESTHLHAISMFSATKDVRYYLNGVMLHAGGLVATDGHRLGSIEHETGLGEGAEIILPLDAVKDLGKKLGMRGKREAVIEIYRDESGRLHLTAGYNGREYVEICTAIDGKFPDWRRVVPKPEILDASTHADTDRCLNWYYMADFQKAADFMTGEAKGHASVVVRMPDSNKSSMRVTVPKVPEFLGVIMPKRI